MDQYTLTLTFFIDSADTADIALSTHHDFCLSLSEVGVFSLSDSIRPFRSYAK